MKVWTHRTTCVGAGLIVWSLLANTASGAVKNFTFQGTITYVEDMEFVLDGSVTNGSPFQGFYIFESTTPDSNSDPTVGDYWHTNSTFGVVIQAGNYVFRTNPRHVDFLVEVVNRTGDDHYLLRSYHNVCSQPLMVAHIAWQLDDSTDTAITNAALPAVPPKLASFQSSFGFTVEGFFSTYFIRGTVTSISNAPAIIPERPVTTIGDAIEIKWPSRLGYFYQIQRSQDMIAWTNIGEPILGDGSVLSRFFPRGTNALYRAEIANFPE